MDTSTKKLIKKTTPSQFRILVDSMNEFSELATYIPLFEKSKAEIEAKWDVVAQKINAAGPPIRNASDWKRVWADLKCRTKAKIAENTKEMKVTGGGPTYYNALTDLEKDIDRICQLSSAADPGGKVFGSDSYTNRKESIVLENDGEEGQEIKLLRLQVEQNNQLVTEMKVQSRSLDSMAGSLRGIEHVMTEMLKYFTEE